MRAQRAVFLSGVNLRCATWSLPPNRRLRKLIGAREGRRRLRPSNVARLNYGLPSGSVPPPWVGVPVPVGQPVGGQTTVLAWTARDGDAAGRVAVRSRVTAPIPSVHNPVSHCQTPADLPVAALAPLGEAMNNTTVRAVPPRIRPSFP